MDRDYDVTQRRPDVFLLNGRSFPYTLRDTPIRVTSGERVLLRVLNAGERVVHLHAHGHHVIVVARDGYELPAAAREVRDVVTVGPAQRVDLELRPGDDGVYASGPGVWIMHDHTERATTNHGISPGGDMTAIIYDGFEGPDGLPRVATDLARYFDPGYYQGKVPVFDPEIYHEKGMADAPLAPGASYPRRDDANDESRRPDLMESHRIVARSCTSPKGVRRVRISEGTQAAGPGAVYGFAPNVIHVAPCETVEIALENTDQIRHDVMIPGLDPMFTLDFRGPGREAGHFVTPDHDVTLEFHCHVPGHEAIGMRGLIIVGKGSPGTESMVAALHHATTGAAAAASSVSTAPAGHEAVGSGASTASAKHLYEGVGVLKSVDPRSGRIIIDHKEIPGFMAAMTMSYLVDPADLVKGLKPGEGVDFTIDSDKREIVAIRPTAR
jgi:Cu/Ag efflux protein CusF/plastocyanin